MKKIRLVMESLTPQEKAVVDKAISHLKENRAYSDKPRFWKDMIVIGCQTILADQDTDY